jgi:GH25 family lysozyme M1 (1,4-beta-N-acetylmuramidase)
MVVGRPAATHESWNPAGEPMSLAARRPRRTAAPLLWPVMLIAVLVMTVAWASVPGGVRAATTMFAACDGVNLRPTTSTGVDAVTQVSTGDAVNVVETLEGSAWSTNCAGAVAGSTWYQIDSVNGVSVAATYGVAYLYGATGLFTPVPPIPTPPPTPSPSPDPNATPSPSPTANPFMTEGIDVSHWQGTIDWFSVAASGKRFAFMKASEGTALVDETYQTNRAQAKAVGLYVGAYHFARPSPGAGDAVAEADHFLATAQIAQGELLPVLDLEQTGGLSVNALQAWVQSYLGRIYERTGVRALIYSSPTFWRNAMGDTDWFAQNGYRSLWVAHWTTAVAPSVPGGNWGGQGWTFWQYTSSGAVPGIVGRVDLNRFNGTDLTPLLLTSTPYIPPEPTGPPAGSIELTSSAPTPVGAQSPVVNWGESLELNVAFGGGGANRTFQLEASRDHLAWTALATLTTDASGNATFAYRPVTNLYYRVAFLGALDLPAATSNEVRTVVRQTSALRPTSAGSIKTIRRGTAITFTTTVRPARAELVPATVSFYLYRRVSGSWQLVSRREVVIDAAGLARTRFTFASTGQWYVRSQANSTPVNANSVMSPPERFTVR